MPTPIPTFNLIWASVEDIDTPAPIKWISGWSVEIPTRQDMDFIHKKHMLSTKHIVENGLAAWDAETEYQQHGMSTKNGMIHIARVANSNVDPDNDTTNNFWLPMSAFRGTPGDIKMFDGDVATMNTLLRAGWALCNGQNGTPDLREHFLLGAESSGRITGSNTYYPNGNAVASVSYDPDHTHTTYTRGHELTENQIPDHVHSSNHTHPAKTTVSGGSHSHGTGYGEHPNYNGYAPFGIRSSAHGYGNAEGVDNDNYYYRTSTDGSHTHSFNTPYFTGNAGLIGSDTQHLHPSTTSSSQSSHHNHSVYNSVIGLSTDNQPRFYTAVFMKFL